MTTSTNTNFSTYTHSLTERLNFNLLLYSQMEEMRASLEVMRRQLEGIIEKDRAEFRRLEALQQGGALCNVDFFLPFPNSKTK